MCQPPSPGEEHRSQESQHTDSGGVRETIFSHFLDQAACMSK